MIQAVDEDIFVFQGPEWVMKINVEFFLRKSLARCKAVIKNAFLHYYMNKEELEQLLQWMIFETANHEVKHYDKFQKLIEYIKKEVEKHGN